MPKNLSKNATDHFQKLIFRIKGLNQKSARLTTKLRGYISKFVEEEKFLNSTKVHFWKITFKVRTHTVITRIFKILKSDNFG